MILYLWKTRHQRSLLMPWLKPWVFQSLSYVQYSKSGVKGNNAFASSSVGLITEHAFSQNMLKAKSKYEKMWEGYHQLIIGDELHLSSMWQSVLDCAESPLYFQHFMQLVTRRVMDEVVKTIFDFEPQAKESASNVQEMKNKHCTT